MDVGRKGYAVFTIAAIPEPEWSSSLLPHGRNTTAVSRNKHGAVRRVPERTEAHA